MTCERSGAITSTAFALDDDFNLLELTIEASPQ